MRRAGRQLQPALHHRLGAAGAVGPEALGLCCERCLPRLGLAHRARGPSNGAVGVLLGGDGHRQRGLGGGARRGVPRVQARQGGAGPRLGRLRLVSLALKLLQRVIELRCAPTLVLGLRRELSDLPVEVGLVRLLRVQGPARARELGDKRELDLPLSTANPLGLPGVPLLLASLPDGFEQGGRLCLPRLDHRRTGPHHRREQGVLPAVLDQGLPTGIGHGPQGGLDAAGLGVRAGEAQHARRRRQLRPLAPLAGPPRPRLRPRRPQPTGRLIARGLPGDSCASSGDLIGTPAGPRRLFEGLRLIGQPRPLLPRRSPGPGGGREPRRAPGDRATEPTRADRRRTFRRGAVGEGRTVHAIGADRDGREPRPQQLRPKRPLLGRQPTITTPARPGEAGLVQPRPEELGAPEVGAVEVGPGEIGAAEVRPPEVRASEPRPDEPRPAQIRVEQEGRGQVGPGQIRPAERRALQVHPAPAEPGEARAAQVRPPEPGADEPGRLELGAAQVSGDELRPREIDAPQALLREAQPKTNHAATQRGGGGREGSEGRGLSGRHGPILIHRAAPPRGPRHAARTAGPSRARSGGVADWHGSCCRPGARPLRRAPIGHALGFIATEWGAP